MKLRLQFKHILFPAIIIMGSVLSGQTEPGKTKEEPKDLHTFTIDTQVKATPVKSQGSTGTCWCFASVSFIESELLRLGKGEYDLSEMFFIRNTYPIKAENFIRYQGRANYGQGGQAHDLMNQIKRFGIVPEDAYTGRPLGEVKHNHGEMVSVTESMLKAYTTLKSGKLSPGWKPAYESVLDVYLGKVPQTFTWKGKSYTPASFRDELGLNPDDYVELTSYTHHPFYQKCRLEVPDNWSGDLYYNVPMDDLTAVIDNALKNGYSVDWDGDVSEHEFSQKKGYAVIPVKDWDDKSAAEKEEKVTEPEKEKVITQEMRQETFNNFTTQDDHLMHITGLAHDQNNTRFYYTKNSWGQEQTNGGYIYLSLPYIQLKTIAIMVHKNAIPKDIAAKLNLK